MTICRTQEDLTELVGRWRIAGERIAMTSGVFDLLHRGHMETLGKARTFGDRLIVATNTDESVKRKKGPLRPINILDDRMFALDSLRCVDAVVSFDEDGDQPLALVECFRPDVFVKSSGEWTERTFVFKQIVEEYGGRAELVSHSPGYSTSKLIEKILSTYRK